MGGCCCCCSSRRSVVRNTLEYRYGPRASEERIPLSPYHVAPSAVSTGLLVDTNLETSIIDTYTPPPQPVPYNVNPQTPAGGSEIRGNKSNSVVQTTSFESIEGSVGNNSSESTAKCEDLKESECKDQADIELALSEKLEIELSKSREPVPVDKEEEEDDCPICLEEYDAENPKSTTKCEHHFHLACILEWMERSDTCPVCDQEMIFSDPIDD